MGKLTDDRPPSNLELVKAIDAAEADVARLKKLFSEHNPKHFTINDK